jgi:hypothetical protein
MHNSESFTDNIPFVQNVGPGDTITHSFSKGTHRGDFLKYIQTSLLRSRALQSMFN